VGLVRASPCSVGRNRLHTPWHPVPLEPDPRGIGRIDEPGSLVEAMDGVLCRLAGHHGSGGRTDWRP
jgi:hypothetical protein